MKTYRARFERINFGYDPVLKQTADVVFSTDIPHDNDHIDEFEKCMWENMWSQNWHWKNPCGPLIGRPGWSSVLFENKVVEIS